MKCECDKIDGYFAGTLTVAQEAQFQEHLMDCPACRERLAAYRKLSVAFEQEERRPTWRRLGRFLQQSRWTRVAALFVLISTIGIGYYSWTRPSGVVIQPGQRPEVIWSVDSFPDASTKADTLMRDSIPQMPAHIER